MGGVDAQDSAADVVTLAACDERIAALNERIRSHGGRVHISSYDESTGRLRVRMEGLCTACPAWPATLYGLIRPYLREELGLEDVEVEGRRLSESAAGRLEAALGGVR